MWFPQWDFVKRWAYICDFWSIVLDTQKSLKRIAPAAPEDCWWAGTAPFCKRGGYCSWDDKALTCVYDDCGDGKCCWAGRKVLCCRDYCRRMSIYIKSHEKVTHPYWWSIWSALQWTVTGDDDYDDYCPKGTTILCPPTAKTNEECTCVKHWGMDTYPIHLDRRKPGKWNPNDLMDMFSIHVFAFRFVFWLPFHNINTLLSLVMMLCRSELHMCMWLEIIWIFVHVLTTDLLVSEQDELESWKIESRIAFASDQLKPW